MSKYIDAEEITPIMAEYIADVFSRKEHLDDISYGYCMEIADAFRRYAKRAEQEQPEQPVEGLYEEVNRYYSDNFAYLTSDQPTLSIIANIARHFAEWGAKHLKK